jgi:hypothetical protein
MSRPSRPRSWGRARRRSRSATASGCCTRCRAREESRLGERQPVEGGGAAAQGGRGSGRPLPRRRRARRAAACGSGGRPRKRRSADLSDGGDDGAAPGRAAGVALARRRLVGGAGPGAAQLRPRRVRPAEASTFYSTIGPAVGLTIRCQTADHAGSVGESDGSLIVTGGEPTQNLYIASRARTTTYAGSMLTRLRPDTTATASQASALAITRATTPHTSSTPTGNNIEVVNHHRS